MVPRRGTRTCPLAWCKHFEDPLKRVHADCGMLEVALIFRNSTFVPHERGAPPNHFVSSLLALSPGQHLAWLLLPLPMTLEGVISKHQMVLFWVHPGIPWTVRGALLSLAVLERYNSRIELRGPGGAI